jgi:LPS export ABC transporter permease LptF/LPS export ABC transporter permease LptG
MVQQKAEVTVIRTLDRYVFAELLPPFVLGVGLLTFFLFIDRIYRLTELIVNKGVPFPLVFQLLLLMLPSFLSLTLPMALLVATLIATGRLAADLEVVALKTAGVSPLRLFRPFLSFALAVSLVAGTMSLLAAPWSNGAFQRLLFRILQTRATAGIKERVFNTTFGQIVIYVEEVSASQVGLRGLLVSDERNPTLSRIITARQGRLLTDEENRRVTLRLIDGSLNEADTGSPARYRHTVFGLYDMTLPLEGPLATVARQEKPEKDMSLRRLRRHVIALRREGQNSVPFEVEYHKRLATPLAVLVFSAVAFPLGIRSHRSGRAVAIFGSLAILMSYYLLLTSLEGIALARRMPAWVAMWSPNVLMGLAGVALLKTSTTSVPASWANLIGRLWRLVPRRASTEGKSLSRAKGAGRKKTRRESTHIIDRYLIRQYLTYIGYGVVVGSVLFIVVDLLQTLDRYLRVKPPILSIMEHFLYRLPPNLYQGLPLIVLVATIFLFLNLNRHHELTALKAAGVSLYRVGFPVLLLTLGISVGAVIFQETLMPVLNAKGEEVDRMKIRGELPRHLQQRTQIWYRSSDTRFFHMDLLDPLNREMRGVTILEIDREYRLLNRLDAAKARWTAEGWEFEAGMAREFGPGILVEAVPFSLTSLQLPESIDDFTQIQKPPDTMSYRELRAYLLKIEESGHRVSRYVVQLYSKLSFPLIHVVMALVAIPFALQSTQGGRLIGIGLSVVIAAGYWLVHSLAISLARAELLPPLAAAWAANVVFAGLGLSLFFRVKT